MSKNGLERLDNLSLEELNKLKEKYSKGLNLKKLNSSLSVGDIISHMAEIDKRIENFDKVDPLRELKSIINEFNASNTNEIISKYEVISGEDGEFKVKGYFNGLSSNLEYILHCNLQLVDDWGLRSLDSVTIVSSNIIKSVFNTGLAKDSMYQDIVISDNLMNDGTIDIYFDIPNGHIRVEVDFINSETIISCGKSTLSSSAFETTIEDDETGRKVLFKIDIISSDYIVDSSLAVRFNSADGINYVSASCKALKNAIKLLGY